jgi:hypothetical protein
VAEPSETPTAKAVVGAAVLVVAGYALVNLDRVSRTVQTLTGGWLNLGASHTRSKSFDNGCSLEMYWSSGSLHYRACCKSRPSGGAPMMFSLRNRFGGELVRLVVPTEAFKPDDKDKDRWVAVGSISISEGDYWEIVDSPAKAGARLAD